MCSDINDLKILMYSTLQRAFQQLWYQFHLLRISSESLNEHIDPNILSIFESSKDDIASGDTRDQQLRESHRIHNYLYAELKPQNSHHISAKKIITVSRIVA
jgi:hypothetical protein